MTRHLLLADTKFLEKRIKEQEVWLEEITAIHCPYYHPLYYWQQLRIESAIDRLYYFKELLMDESFRQKEMNKCLELGI